MSDLAGARPVREPECERSLEVGRRLVLIRPEGVHWQ